MAESKIALWNCSGLRATTDSTAHKMGFFDKEFPNASFALAIFVETHHRGEDDFPNLFKEYETTHNVLHTPTPPDHSHSGVIILIRKDFEIISTMTKIPGRLLNVHFKDKVEDKTYNLSAYYGYHLKNIHKTDLYILIQNFYQLHTRNDNNIILGDFNFVDNNLDKGKGMTSHDKKISDIWEAFKRKICIVDPFREHFPTTKMFSFYNNNGQSRVDRIYVSPDQVNSVKDITYRRYSLPNTHKLLSLSLTPPEEKGPGYWKMNTSLLQDPNYRKLITDSITRSKVSVIEDPTTWWQVLLLKLRSETLSFSQQKKYVENKLRRS